MVDITTLANIQQWRRPACILALQRNTPALPDKASGAVMDNHEEQVKGTLIMLTFAFGEYTEVHRQ